MGDWLPSRHTVYVHGRCAKGRKYTEDDLQKYRRNVCRKRGNSVLRIVSLRCHQWKVILQGPDKWRLPLETLGRRQAPPEFRLEYTPVFMQPCECGLMRLTTDFRFGPEGLRASNGSPVTTFEDKIPTPHHNIFSNSSSSHFFIASTMSSSFPSMMAGMLLKFTLAR